MTQQEMEQAYQSALDDAAKQLGYRALSIASLKEKLLNKGHMPDAVEYAIAFLQEHGLVNDQQYAQAMVHSYTRRGYGVMRIQQELRRRGVEQEDAELALQECETDFSLLYHLLDKKLKGDVSDQKQIQRTIAFLQRRGFSWSDIRKALQEYKEQLME